MQPSLILLASTAGGRDIAPRLAAHLGGAYFAEPAVEAGPRGEVVLSRTVYGGDLWRRVSLDELDVVAVVTLDDRRAAATGEDDAEVMQLEGTSPPDARIEVLGASEDEGAALERARVIVVAGAGTTAESIKVVGELARARQRAPQEDRDGHGVFTFPPSSAINLGTRSSMVPTRPQRALLKICAAGSLSMATISASDETAPRCATEPDAPHTT